MYQSPYKGFNSWKNGMAVGLKSLNPPIRGSIAIGSHTTMSAMLVSIPYKGFNRFKVKGTEWGDTSQSPYKGSNRTR